MDGTGLTTLETGLIQNYGLCLDRYARHVYYIQGGHGGSISCKAYGSTPCNTPTYVRVCNCLVDRAKRETRQEVFSGVRVLCA